MGGLAFSKIWQRMIGRQDMRILMVGLDAAGKTTLLYKLKLREVVSTIPTIGFNLEIIRYKNISFKVWDCGYRDKLIPLFANNFQDTRCPTHGLIYVIDSSDLERIEESREVLQSLLEHDRLKDTALLVFANKQDLPGAMNISEVESRLELENHSRRKWFIQSACAFTGEGIMEGLEWMANALKCKE